MSEQHHEKTAEPLIIENAASVSFPIRFGWGLVAAIFWAIWVYLWMPLVTTVAWIESIIHIHNRVWIGEIKELERLSVWYLLTILILGSCLLLWALSQYVRFRNSKRRLMPISVQTSELAEFTGLAENDLAIWQHEQWITVHHDEHGRIVGVVMAN